MIEMKFNCPYAPHTGGLFERLVRSVKRCLHFILTKHKLDFDAFDTALFKVSSILNSRPLTHGSNDINSMYCLSPRDFLSPYMVTNEYTYDPPITTDSAELRGSWGDMRRIVGEFKERFMEEYIVTLQNRPKWGAVKEEMYEGQLVLVAEPNMPRTHWNLGRVEEKVPSPDGITRRYKVKMTNGHVWERHHNVLVPLELEYKDEKVGNEDA